MRERIFLLAVSILLVAGFGIKAEAQKTFVVPHFIEKVGLVSNTQFTFDTTFFVTYTGGIASTDLAPGASISLYIYDDLTGLPLKSLTNIDVCNPCNFSVNTTNRKALGNVEGLANSVGGLPRADVTGSMLLIAAGDVESMELVANVVNAHTSPQDVSSLPLSLSELNDGPSTGLRNHFREDEFAANNQFVFSHDLHAYYSGGLPGTTAGAGATVNLRLYDDLTGLPLLSQTNQPVCNPCTADLSAAARKHLFSFDALIRAAGGFPRPDVRGFATVQLVGDTRNVFLQNIATNTHTGPTDVELHALDPTGGLEFLGPTGPLARAGFSMPIVYERQGRADNTPFTFDTNISMSYMGGLPGFPAGTGATVDLTIFDEITGLPMKTATNQDVCNPCTTVLGPTNRKVTTVVDDVIVAKGGFDVPVKTGFGILVIGGADPDNVALRGFVVNSHTSAFDLSVFGFDPQPILADPGTLLQKTASTLRERPGGRSEGSRRILSAEYNYPHFRDRTGKASNTTFTFDSEFHAVYNGTTTANLEVYLYDQMTSQPLLSLTNQPICDPCNLPLNTTTKKRRIIVDDLITAAGGFPRLDVAGFAKIKVTGDAGRVGILGALVNAHSGPNDLSTSHLPGRRQIRRTTDYDFNGDGRADIGVFRPNDPLGSMFYLLQTGNNAFSAFQWGLPIDTPVPADYDGDAKTDVAIWRPTGNDDPNHWIFLSSTLSTRFEHFGTIGDDPSVTGDYDGDGKADLAVYREGATPGAQSVHYHRPSSIPGVDFKGQPWGLHGDRPLRGDYDGDGKEDITVFRPADQLWYILQSETNSLRVANWGLATDKLVPADYDGDGRTDLAAFRNGVWHIRQSREEFFNVLFWGIANDLPVPADYDGDGRCDLAIFRNGVWYIRFATGQFRVANFGQGGDIPLSVRD